MITKTKLVKRIFSSLLTAALAVPMTALTAHATGEAFFYPPKNPVMTDQQFEVSVTFSADSEIGSVQANIAYDDSVIEFVSSDNASGGGGVLTVNGFPDTPSSEVDFSFTFKGLSAGNANISLQSCQIYSPDSELIGSPTAYCVITVGGDKVETKTETETTTTTGTAPAAGGEGQTPQQTNQQPTTPTAEQRTAFQKFWDSLFGGKEEPAPGSGEGTKKDGDPAPKEGEGTKQEPQGGKSYSEADVEAKIAEAKAAWEAEQQEKQRLAKLSPEERAKAEGEAQAQELTKLRTELLQRDLKDAAVKKLTDEGFPVGLADLLTYTDKESMEKSLQQTQEVFKSALEAAVKERLRGKTPEGLGGGAKAENTVKDQIAQGIRGGMM